jgi:preprotein translocase subunit SecY
VQIDVGIKGVAPGYNTQQFLQEKVRQCKFWGGLALAGLAVTAHLFDQLCLCVVGTTLATTSLVIIVGAVLQTSRQVSVMSMCAESCCADELGAATPASCLSD